MRNAIGISPLGLLTLLGVISAPALASQIQPEERSFFELLAWAGGTFLGTVGYVEYDSHSFDQYYEWLVRQDACWDQSERPCLELPDHYRVELAISRAVLTIKGRTFNTDDVKNWTYVDRCYPYCDASVGFGMQDQSGDSLSLSCLGYRGNWPDQRCGDAFTLSYSIRGQLGDQDDLWVSWRTIEEASWPTREPGTLALLGLGLAGLGLSRRRKAN